MCIRDSGKATSSAVDAIARQPEAESKISKSLLLGCALAEATALYEMCIRDSPMTDKCPATMDVLAANVITAAEQQTMNYYMNTAALWPDEMLSLIHI